MMMPPRLTAQRRGEPPSRPRSRHAGCGTDGRIAYHVRLLRVPPFRSRLARTADHETRISAALRYERDSHRSHGESPANPMRRRMERVYQRRCCHYDVFDSWKSLLYRGTIM